MKQFATRSRAAGVLLAVIVMGTAADGLRAADAPPPTEAPDLRLIPADAAGFVTVRVAGVADKLGLKEARGLALLANWQMGFAGVRTTDLERFTVIYPTPTDDPVSVYHTAKSCEREAVLKALAPDAKPVKRADRVFHVNAAGAAVYFADNQTFVYGPDKVVTEVVGKRGAEGKTHLAAAVRQAADHDAFIWSRTQEPQEIAKTAPATCVARRRTVTSCYKPAGGGGPGGLPYLADILPPRGALALCGDCPMPAGVEAADAFLDLGERTVLGMHLYFTDEDSAQSGAKLVRVGRDMTRAMLLMAVTQFSAIECLPELVGAGGADDMDGFAALAPAVLPVCRPLEKALEKVTIEAEGTTVPVTVSVPVNAKKVRAAVVAGLTLAVRGGCSATADAIPLLPYRAWTPGTAGPAGQMPVCPPQPGVPVLSNMYGPVQPCVPAPPGVLPPRLPPEIAAQVYTSPVVPAGAMMPAFPPSPYTASHPQCPTPTAPAPATMPPCCVPADGPTTPTSPPRKVATLTVANVSGESALLFSEGEGGKLDFSRKVPAGDAVDVETTTGKRPVAIFTDNPASAMHVTASDGKPWLLRPVNPQPKGATYAPSASSPR